MEELVQEYGKVILAVIIGAIVLAVIAYSWGSIGEYMAYFNDTIVGGNQWNSL